MSRKTAFWSIWSIFTASVILFFYTIGELEYMDLFKAILLTTLPLVVAIPLYYWIKENENFN